MSNDDRRRSPRNAVLISADFLCGDDCYSGMILDLSRHGAFLTFESDIPDVTAGELGYRDPETRQYSKRLVAVARRATSGHARGLGLTFVTAVQGAAPEDSFTEEDVTDSAMLATLDALLSESEDLLGFDDSEEDDAAEILPSLPEAPSLPPLPQDPRPELAEPGPDTPELMVHELAPALDESSGGNVAPLTASHSDPFLASILDDSLDSTPDSLAASTGSMVLEIIEDDESDLVPLGLPAPGGRSYSDLPPLPPVPPPPSYEEVAASYGSIPPVSPPDEVPQAAAEPEPPTPLQASPDRSPRSVGRSVVGPRGPDGLQASPDRSPRSAGGDREVLAPIGEAPPVTTEPPPQLPGAALPAADRADVPRRPTPTATEPQPSRSGRFRARKKRRDPAARRWKAPIVSVLFEGPRGGGVGQIVDASAKGFRVSCNQPPRKGARMTFRFRPEAASDGGVISASGKVAWSTRDLAAQGPQGFGVRVVRFDSLDDERRYADFLESIRERRGGS